MRKLITLTATLVVALFAFASPSFAAQPSEKANSWSNPNWSCLPGVQDHCYKFSTSANKPSGITAITIYSDDYIPDFSDVPGGGQNAQWRVSISGATCSTGNPSWRHTICTGLSSAQSTITYNVSIDCDWYRNTWGYGNPLRYLVYNNSSPWQWLYTHQYQISNNPTACSA